MSDVYTIITRSNIGWITEPEEERAREKPPRNGFRNYIEDKLVDMIDKKERVNRAKCKRSTLR